MSQIADLRRDYKKHILTESEVNANPFSQFQIWFSEAMEAKVHEPNAFTLSTVNEQGHPSGRIVLLKGLDEDGFVFYTNYDSHKAQEIAYNPHVSMVFLWHELERQIRVKGRADKVSREESTAYFNSRPRESQLGAWSSPQSTVIDNRAFLDQRLEECKNKYANQAVIPIPDQWGGYRIIPSEIEFWQGRSNRLHDRLLYQKAENTWHISRLAP